MKKTYIIFVVIALISNVVVATDIIEKLNFDINDRYGRADFFKSTSPYGSFNTTVFSDYQVPVYGKPHGDYKNVNGVMEPRFIGYADNGESVPNPVFPVDELGDYELSTLPWVMRPWKNDDVLKLSRFKNIKRTHFDDPPDLFVSSLLQKLNQDFGKNGEVYPGIFTPELAKDTAWTDYMHVIVPLTSISKGLVVMFHTNGGTLWYMDVVLKPLEALKGTLHIKTVTESGMLIEEKTVELLSDSTTAHTRLKSNHDSTIDIESTSRERYTFTTCCYFNLTIMQVAL